MKRIIQETPGFFTLWPAVLGGGVLGFILSLLLLCKQILPELCVFGAICGVGESDGCLALARSPRSLFFGLPLPWSFLGLHFYSFVLILLVRGGFSREPSRGISMIRLALFTTLMGTAMTLYLAFVNLFVLPAPCNLCSLTYGCTLLLLLGTLFYDARLRSKFNHRPDWQWSKRPFLFTGGLSLLLTLLSSAGIIIMASRQARLSATEKITLPANSRIEQIITRYKTLSTVKMPVTGLKTFSGDSKAYIEIHKFSEFRCPHCKNAAVLLKQARKRWPGRIKVFYRYFPIDGACNSSIKRKLQDSPSCLGARAALCSAGKAYFEPLYYGIFDLQVGNRPINRQSVETLLKDFPGARDTVFNCLATERPNELINRDVADALKIPLKGTPTLILGDKLLPPQYAKRRTFLNLLDALVYEREGDAAFKEFKARVQEKPAGTVDVNGK